MINGNIVGYCAAPLQTVILVDENGNEITGVVTDSEVILDVKDEDVKAGKTYVGNNGISTGTHLCE